MAPEKDSSDGVYAISVAAELSGLGLSSLRLYERRGLLTPSRTEGGTRRYSEDDMHRLRRIGELVESGLNIEGIRMVLELEEENARLRAQLKRRLI
jgi:DNA-binding transcriptional MerR regulator